MSLIRSAVLALVVCLAMVSAAGQRRIYNPTNSADPKAIEVSLIQLIANPQAYDNKRIRVTGFLNLGPDGNAIYLHQEDFENVISRDAIWIDVPKDMTEAQRSEARLHYVVCEGRFVAGRHGALGLYSGEITDVMRIDLWFRHEETPGKK
jgi:hypothetical protein